VFFVPLFLRVYAQLRFFACSSWSRLLGGWVPCLSSTYFFRALLWFTPGGRMCAFPPSTASLLRSAQNFVIRVWQVIFYPEGKDVRFPLGCPAALCEAYRTSCPGLKGMKYVLYDGPESMRITPTLETASLSWDGCAPHYPGPTVFDRQCLLFETV